MPDVPGGSAAQDELTAIDERLAALENEKQRLLQRRQALLHAPQAHAQVMLSPEQKVTLFRGLFRGRTDVFATRWQNAGRHGYSVACHNEWVPGVCQKRKGVKCGDCSHKHFKQLDDQAIYDHLSGKQVVGRHSGDLGRQTEATGQLLEPGVLQNAGIALFHPWHTAIHHLCPH